MNVFEDLIEELRDENLLEDTVIKVAANEKPKSSPRNGASADPALEHTGTVDTQLSEATDTFAPRQENEAGEVSNEDFYRKRAMDEVSGLQMVEHVMSGIEREHMKVAPNSYDELQAKKALHEFLQVLSDTASAEYSEAESRLMRETEAWNAALSERDQKVSVANLRRFCENSRPALSSQALIALARFYRNSPFSEPTRAKFEFVMTRLFSRELDGEKRKVLFGRTEMIGHIKNLYASWSSLALYSADNAALKIRAIVAGFEDRMAEAESALTFDQLVQNDFFAKVHEFKEGTGEVFFAPEVVAATIDCNTQVGNKFIDLIRLERERTNFESVEQKYGYQYDGLISDAAAKTLQLVEVFKNVPKLDEDFDVSEETTSPRPVTKRSIVKAKQSEPRFKFELFAVNKWLLLLTIIVVTVSTGLYFWANESSNESSAAESAEDVSFDNSELKEYVRSGRATPNNLYAITLPSWDQLDEAKKREILKKALEVAKQKGKESVQLVNARGRSVGFASSDSIEVLNP